jgi:hypothetical protein
MAMHFVVPSSAAGWLNWNCGVMNINTWKKTGNSHEARTAAK